MLFTAHIDLATSTLHWFAQIGDDFTGIDDDGGGKKGFFFCYSKCMNTFGNANDLTWHEKLIFQ